MKSNDIVEQTIYGGLIGEYSITNCRIAGYLASRLYPRQHEQDTRSERHYLQDGISQKPASDRCGKKDSNS